MAATLPLPTSNSTNVRLLISLVARRVGLNGLAALSPGLAGLWAERLFLTPPRPAEYAHRFFDFLEARYRPFEYRSRTIALWQWGPADAPGVLLVHGWGGGSVQMRGFVQPLLAAGFRVIAYDQPAHGLSGGRITGLPEFAEVTSEVLWRHEGVVAAIGHSLGASGLAAAAARSAHELERLVLVSAPADFVGFSRRFARWHGMSERIRGRMQAATEERYGERWADFGVDRIAATLRARTLVIHGRNDRVAPLGEGRSIAEALPRARILTVPGGHHALLRDPFVIDCARDFLAGRSDVAGFARPAIPLPSPLY